MSTTLALGEWAPETMSVAEQLAVLPIEDRRAIEATMSPEERDALQWDWDFWSRPDQRPPDDFGIWVVVAGRGSGKTRTATEWVRRKGPLHAEGLIIGANPRDVRDIILEGRSGIITISPPWDRPEYEPTKLLLRWPNGAVAHVRSAEDPGSIRGLSAEWMYGDELVKWRYLQETWDQARLALREGQRPQTVVTTTPMPLPLIKKLVEGGGRGVVVAPKTSTYRNAANLAPDYLAELLETYEGTRLGRQELHAEILEDVKGAMWNTEMIEGARWNGEWVQAVTGLWLPVISVKRKVVAVDPSGSATGDECGIIVVGASNSRPPVGHVLDDRSTRGTPEQWGRAALRAYVDHDCEMMIGEVNFGGEMVERIVRAVPAEGGYPSGDSIRFKSVRASKGMSKHDRAVPIVGFFEQNLRGFRRVYLVGNFPDLETQLTQWVPPENEDAESPASKWSPDRLDAMVWGLLYLMVIQARRQGHTQGAALRAATI